MTTKVDFELLVEFVNELYETPTNVDNAKKVCNLKLFLDVLTTSSAFAHKAHKELEKISQNKLT